MLRGRQGGAGWVLLLGVLVLGVVGAPLRAEASDTKAAAEALFVEGRRLMEQGNYAQACSKFESSQKLDPGLGTMLNLADCYEKSGRTASAWAQYREVVPAARAAGSDERANVAEERALSLESRLSTLTIRVTGDTNLVDLEVLRDGMPVEPAMLSTAIPVDPGQHEIVARAPGYATWSTEIHVGTERDQVVVDVPALRPEPVRSEGGPIEAQVAQSARPAWPAQKTWALVTGGVGLLSLATAGVLTGVAAAELSAAKNGCPTYPNGCSSESSSHNSNAATFGDIATAGYIVGGATLALGAVLWFTAPKTQSTQVGLGLATVEVRGTF